MTWIPNIYWIRLILVESSYFGNLKSWFVWGGACFGCWDRWRELKYHPHGTVDNDRTRCNKMISANSQVIQKLKTKIPYGSWWNWNAFAFQSLFFLCAPILNSSVKGKKPVESKMLGCLSFSFLPWTKMNPNVEIGAQADLDVDLEIPCISIKMLLASHFKESCHVVPWKTRKVLLGTFSINKSDFKWVIFHTQLLSHLSEIITV